MHICRGCVEQILILAFLLHKRLQSLNENVRHKLEASMIVFFQWLVASIKS